MEIYKIKVSCTNCGEDNESLGIPKGITVLDYLKGTECEYCGCKTLKEEIPKPSYRY